VGVRQGSQGGARLPLCVLDHEFRITSFPLTASGGSKMPSAHSSRLHSRRAVSPRGFPVYPTKARRRSTGKQLRIETGTNLPCQGRGRQIQLGSTIALP